MKKVIQRTVWMLTAAVIAVMGIVGYYHWSLPDSYYIGENQQLSLPQYPSLSISQQEAMPTLGNLSVSREAEIQWMGCIPIKTVSVKETETRYLIPCGTPFGLKMLTQGVLVVGLSPIETRTGTCCPAQEAGLEKGDLILSADGQAVSSFQDLSSVVSRSNGEAVSLEVVRDGETRQILVTPRESLAGEYQCGLWGRDSSAGIGTITFYDPATGLLVGLGHGVCDADTGDLLPLASGEVMPAAILDVIPGSVGTPGELQGSFTSPFAVGTLLNNTNSGIFGILKTAPTRSSALALCPKQEVVEGPAQILTTVKGDEPAAYSIQIEKVSYAAHTPDKNMVIRVDDPALLSITGGIVQGMSGSPIIQNGKLVGAVTHVFVNDPTRGYGIFAENMLEAADSLQ